MQNKDNTVKLIKKESNTVGGTVGATKEIVGYEIETDIKKSIKKELIQDHSEVKMNNPEVNPICHS